MSKRYILIEDLQEPTRLDRYLKRIFPVLTQGIIESYLRKNKIKVNGKKVGANFRVNSGDELLLLGQEIGRYEQRQGADNQTEFASDIISLAGKLCGEYLILENEYFLAVNKPCNLAVQGGSKIKISVDDALRYLSVCNKIDYKLVHRLDRETSGILLIAKGYSAAHKLTKAFKDRAMRKTYIALLGGSLGQVEGVVRNYIAPKGVVDQDAKYAESFFRLVEYIGGNSLVEFRPTTGRMHQLRIHSKLIGHAIIGDKKYGTVPYKRLMLHAQKLEIPEEVFGQNFVIRAESKDFSSGARHLL